MELDYQMPDRDFWQYDGRFMQKMIAAEDDFETFAEQWNDLPADPYLDGNPFRLRRHGRMTIDTDADEIEVLPPGDYLQSSANNPLFGDVARRFAPIDWSPSATRFVSGLIRASVAKILGLPGRSLINLHQVRIVGGPGYAGAPVPEGRHRDGFDFISIHLIDRDVDGGAKTTLLSDEGDITEFTLTKPMDSVYVNDRRMTHDTTPIVGDNRRVYRDVLLMSFERDVNH